MKKNIAFFIILITIISCNKDETPPEINILGDNPIIAPLGVNYVDPGATAYDDIDGDITSYIYTDNNLNTSILGNYYYSYNVTDFSGNETTKNRDIQVVITNLSLEGSWSVSHSCNSLIGINSTQNLEIDANSDYLANIPNFNSLASLSIMIEGSTITVPQQSIELGADVSGTGTINETGNIITLNLDFNIPVLGNESCMLIYTKQ